MNGVLSRENLTLEELIALGPKYWSVSLIGTSALTSNLYAQRWSWWHCPPVYKELLHIHCHL